MNRNSGLESVRKKKKNVKAVDPKFLSKAQKKNKLRVQVECCNKL